MAETEDLETATWFAENIVALLNSDDGKIITQMALLSKEFQTPFATLCIVTGPVPEGDHVAFGHRYLGALTDKQNMASVENIRQQDAARAKNLATRWRPVSDTAKDMATARLCLHLELSGLSSKTLRLIVSSVETDYVYITINSLGYAFLAFQILRSKLEGDISIYDLIARPVSMTRVEMIPKPQTEYDRLQNEYNRLTMQIERLWQVKQARPEVDTDRKQKELEELRDVNQGLIDKFVSSVSIKDQMFKN